MSVDGLQTIAIVLVAVMHLIHAGRVRRMLDMQADLNMLEATCHEKIVARLRKLEKAVGE